MYNCSGRGIINMKSGYLKIFHVIRSITKGLTGEFVSKYVVLGLISNEISWAEHEYFNIYPPPINTAKLQN